MAEVVVSALLIAAMISFLGTLVVRNGHMWRETRHVQLAMDELTNQIERITSLPANDIDAALDQLKPSDEVSQSLPDAKLIAKVIDDKDGRRLQLTLDWDRGVPALPLTLVGWIDASLSLIHI